MVNFLVTVGVVCFLPFVIAMLESGIRKYVHARAVINQFAGVEGGCAGGLTRAFDLRGYEFTPVIYPPSLPGRWSRQHLLSAPTEGSSSSTTGASAACGKTGRSSPRHPTAAFAAARAPSSTSGTPMPES